MDVYKTPGAFSWSELTTPDPAAAAVFYSELFGWTVKDLPEMGGYRIASIDGTSVAGIMAPPPDAGPMPTAWGVYMTVADADAAAAKAVALGGKVLMPGTDIPGVGRMAVLQDPQGAVFSVMAYSAPST